MTRPLPRVTALAVRRSALGAAAALLLTLVLYWLPFRGAVNVGDAWDGWFLTGPGVYAPEQGGGIDYRWVDGAATVRLPGLGGGPLTVSLWPAGPQGAREPDRLTWRANGHALPPVALAPAEARVDAAVPAAWLGPGGDLTLTLEAPAIQSPGERRPLGFLLDRVAVAGGPGPAWPPAAVALAALLLGGWVARLRGRALLVGALVAGAGLAAGIAGARPWIGLHAGTAAALLALAGAAVLLSPAAGARRPAAWLAVGLLAGYLLLLPGHFYVIDDDTKFAVTQSLVTRGSLFPVLPDGTAGPSKYGLGHSLATAPLLLLALAVEALRGGGPLGELRKLAVLLLDPLCTAATAGLLYLGARRLWPSPADGGATARALGVALVYGLATFALPHALFAFSEPLIGLLLLAAVAAVARAADGPRGVAWALGAGAAAGFLLLTKAEYGLVVAGLLAYYLARTRRAPAAVRARAVVALLAPVALGLGGALAWNAARFGTPLTFGYADEGFSTPLPVGLAGLLVSPGKSVFLYAPPLLLTLVAWPRFVRAHRALAWLVGGISLGALLFYAAWWDWSGDWTWGPRFLLPLLPLCALAWGGLPLGRPGVRALAGVLVLLGLAAQVPGVLADWRLAFLRTGSTAALAARETALHWDPAWSPLVWGWQHLDAGPRMSAVLHLSDYGLPPALDFWVPVGLAGLVVWCAVMLARGLRAPAAAGGMQDATAVAASAPPAPMP